MKKTIFTISILLAQFATAQLFTPMGSTNPTTNPSDNNVGIGTNNPQQKLSVNGAILTGDISTGWEGSLFLGNPSHGIIRNVNNVSVYTHGADGNLLFKTMFDQERMRVASNGNIGIGGISPVAKFHVFQKASENPIDAVTIDVESFGTPVNSNNSHYFRVRDIGAGGYVPFIIKGNGNVGIGHSSPAYRLDVKGTISSQDNTNEGGAIVLDNTTKTSPNIARKWVIYNMTGAYGNSLQFWNYSTDGSMYGSRLKLSDDGNMALYGKFEAKEVKVTLTPTADFVFEEDYALPKLEDVEKHIKENKHLPEIASAKVMEKEGVNVGEFQIKLLQKIEELTLYTIEQNKQLKKQQDKIEQLQKENSEIKNLYIEVQQLKKQLNSTKPY